MSLKILTEAWMSVELQEDGISRHYFPLTDTLITNKKNWKWMQIMCFIYSWKNSEFSSLTNLFITSDDQLLNLS